MVEEVVEHRSIAVKAALLAFLLSGDAAIARETGRDRRHHGAC
jgi:hypothetical protein